MWILILVVVVIIVLVILFLPPNPIQYYDFGDPKSSLKVCLIAGVHGNEPAGVVALSNLLESDYFDRQDVFVRVIPCVNEFGYKYNIRWCMNIFNPDINRAFSSDNNELATNLLKLIDEYDFDLILDFHEGWGYHLIQEESVGSTISPNSNGLNLCSKPLVSNRSPETSGFGLNLGKKLIENLNKSITDKEKKFTLLENTECEIDSALSCKLKNRNYILVETTGQNDIQPLETRCKQIKTILDTVFSPAPDK